MDTEYEDYLNKARNKLLNYLLDDSEKYINKFKKDKHIETNNKWNYMLTYPHDFIFFQNSKIKITKLTNKIIELLEKNTDRIIHPGLIILCWDKLLTHLSFHYIYDNSGNPLYITLDNNSNNLKKLRHQNIISFQIYCRILNDDKINKFFLTYESNKLIKNFSEKLFYNFEIEKMVRMDLNIYDSCNVRFNDICLNLNIDEDIYYCNTDKKLIRKNQDIDKIKDLTDLQIEYKTKIIIEINEGHHIPIIDNIRKLNIYQITGRLSIEYSYISTDFLSFYNKILKEIAKIIYNNYDNDKGIIFYMSCVNNFDLNIVQFFWDIYKKTIIDREGIQIKDVVAIFRENKNNIKKFYNIIEEELDDSIYFFELNENKFEKSLLSNIGVDKVLLLPRKSDFPNCQNILKIASQYTNFREEVFKSILEFFNNDEESIYIFKLINHINQITEVSENIIKPVIDILYDRLDDNTVKKIEEKYNVNLLKPVPFLVKSKSNYDKIDKKGLISIVNKNIANRIKTRLEPGQITIDNYKFISHKIVKDLLENNI